MNLSVLASRIRGLAQRPELLLVLAAAVFGAWNAAGFLQYNVDDAFISLRYSANIAQGLGPVFNEGERVEGFSNPTWTFLAALPLALGLDGTASLRWMGIFSQIATIVCAGGLAAALVRPSSRAGQLAATSGAWFAALSMPMAYWAVGGLETPLYTALLLGGLWRLRVEAERPDARPWSAVIAAFAALTRPEAPLLVFGVVLGRALQLAEDRALRPAKQWLALFSVPTVGYLLFRILYYKDIFPNTWYVKGKPASVREIWNYLWPWVNLEPLLVGAGLLGLGALLLRRTRAAIPLAWTLIGAVIFVIKVGGDWMPNQRYAVPVIAVLAPAAGAGLALLAEFLQERARLAAAVGAAVLVAWTGVRSLPVREADMEKGGGPIYTLREAEDWAPASLHTPVTSGGLIVWLLERVPPHAWLGFTDIGLAGYASQWKILDLLGLTSKEISGSTGLDLDGREAFIKKQKLDWIVLAKINTPLQKQLRKAPWLYDQYKVQKAPARDAIVGKRPDAPDITDEEILENFTVATERSPRSYYLLTARARWAAAVGDKKDREAACALFAREFPEEVEVNERCQESIEAGGPRPKTKATWLAGPGKEDEEEVSDEAEDTGKVAKKERNKEKRKAKQEEKRKERKKQREEP